MGDLRAPEIPAELQPGPADVPFDLEETLSGVVSLRTVVPEDGFTARTLGTERAGHACAISKDGLFATIGYLTVEAESVWLIDSQGGAIEACVMGYDQESGFGVVRALGPIQARPFEFGSLRGLHEGDPVLLAGAGGRTGTVKSNVVSIRDFAGYWEYALDEAIFISPPHPIWGGAGLLTTDGTLAGIGSLFVQQAQDTGGPMDGNMVVPIDLLTSVLDELLAYGRRIRPPRPWLGVFSAENQGRVVVAGLAEGGPADMAGLTVGDLIIGVGGEPVADLGSFYRRLWNHGEAGVTVPLNVFRDGEIIEVAVASATRESFLIQGSTLH